MAAGAGGDTALPGLQRAWRTEGGRAWAGDAAGLGASTRLRWRYRHCLALLTHVPLVKLLCEEAGEELHQVAPELFPSQLTAERTRLGQALDALNTWELTAHNNLQILEWEQLRGVHFLSECRAEERGGDAACWASSSKKGLAPGERAKAITRRQNVVLDKCDKRMESVSKARKALRSYVSVMGTAVIILQKAETSLLPTSWRQRTCLASQGRSLGGEALECDFQTHVSRLQTLAPQAACFCPDHVQRLQAGVLSHLLAAKKVVLETSEEICQQVRDAETALAECTGHNITTQQDCNAQRDKLKALLEEVESLPLTLEKLQEWCPVQGCRSNREEAVSALWGQVSRLQRCTQDLRARSDARSAEWTHITKSVEKASIVLEQVEAELPESGAEKLSIRFRLLAVPPSLEQAPPIPLCQELQAMQERYRSLRDKCMLGRRATLTELMEREKVRQELQGVRQWLVAAVTLFTALEEDPSTQQLQEVHSELCTQKAVLQRIMESLRMKYSDMYTLVPVEIEGPLQEVSSSLQEVEEQVLDMVEKSGPLHRLGARVAEIRAGLGSVQSRLKQRSASITEAEATQKIVWDELDVWHSRVACLEVDIQDLSEERPQEAQLLTDGLADTQHLHTLLTKQAEQRTTLLSKTVLDDSAQVRRTLQGFEGVLREMSEVCDVAALRDQLTAADQRVANMQTSFVGPLAQLENAAAEVDAIESEVKAMERDGSSAVRGILSPEGSITNIPKDKLKEARSRIELMKRTIVEIQSCREGLCLPEGAEQTLTVFRKAEQILLHLQQLEKLIPKQVDEEDTPTKEKSPP
ncbi:hypothetical protein AALO_G00000700 [Alosa alosa]|uniref:Uncharacterized protein n=1 Tax=Alosa alosa TaxID=278164 RepID=A0AAV6HI99_9TELE|nr:hypothetical protein AALO_G00000700 [Alosa alosa]